MTAYAEVILHSRTLHAEMFLQTAMGAVLRYYYGHPRSILRFPRLLGPEQLSRRFLQLLKKRRCQTSKDIQERINIPIVLAVEMSS
jgi:hypothetical protein